MKKANTSYSQIDCIIYFRNLKNSEESGCNCIKTLSSSSGCQNSKNETVKKCYDSFLNNFQKRNIFEICSRYCPLECVSSNFLIYTNAEQLPFTGNISGKHNLRFETYEEAHKRFVSLKVYYPQLKYTYISQQPKTEMVDLVSDIGGTLGLFLGISFLSFIEIFDIIFAIIRPLFLEKIIYKY